MKYSIWRTAKALVPRWPWAAHQRAERTSASGVDASVVPGVVVDIERDGHLVVHVPGEAGLQRWHPGRFIGPYGVEHMTVPDLSHLPTLLSGVSLLPGTRLDLSLTLPDRRLGRWSLWSGSTLRGDGVGVEALVTRLQLDLLTPAAPAELPPIVARGGWGRR